MAETEGRQGVGGLAGMAATASESLSESVDGERYSHALDLLQQYLTQSPPAAIPTGFEDFDKYMGGGFHRKSIYVLAGRTREGKSSFALSIARRMAVDARARVIYLSLEMTKQELVERLLCQILMMPLMRLEAARSEGTLGGMVGAARRMLSAPTWFHIEDERGGSIDHLDQLFEEVAEEAPDLLVIDHLQHIPMQHGISRADALSTYMAELKAFAKRRNVIILLCCQINRQGDEKPSLIHLKGSGGIEEVADAVFICNRVNYDASVVASQESPECDYEVWVAKHRRGPEYKFMLSFRPACFEFLMPLRYSAPRTGGVVPVVE